MAEQIAGGLGPNVLTLEGVEPLDEDGDENLVESSSSEAGVHLLIIDLFPTSARSAWHSCGDLGGSLWRARISIAGGQAVVVGVVRGWL